ncbi:MAG: hypothetical protein ACI8UP_004986, partial [Porticoccaceae bacterium]
MSRTDVDHASNVLFRMPPSEPLRLLRTINPICQRATQNGQFSIEL